MCCLHLHDQSGTNKKQPTKKQRAQTCSKRKSAYSDQLSHLAYAMHHWAVTRKRNKYKAECAYVNVLPVWADGLKVVILWTAATKGSRSFCVCWGVGRNLFEWGVWGLKPEWKRVILAEGLYGVSERMWDRVSCGKCRLCMVTAISRDCV